MVGLPVESDAWRASRGGHPPLFLCSGFAILRLCVLCLALVSVGCTTNVRPPAVIENTSLPRPVVVIGGIGDPFYTATQVGRLVKREAGEDRVLGVSPGLAWSFDDAARTVIEAVERHFPDDDPAMTTEVDVIGISMGGLTARHAALPGNGTGQTLNVRRMYTICAPHTGAQGADFFGFFGTALAMRTGSPFLTRLRGRERGAGVDYELVAYARSRDLTIGAGSALPDHLDGQFVWLRTPWYLTGHSFCTHDRRIIEDILHRLAREDAAEPLAAPVAAPVAAGEDRVRGR